MNQEYESWYEFADFNDFQKFKTQASDSDRIDFSGSFRL